MNTTTSHNEHYPTAPAVHPIIFFAALRPKPLLWAHFCTLSCLNPRDGAPEDHGPWRVGLWEQRKVLGSAKGVHIPGRWCRDPGSWAPGLAAGVCAVPQTAHTEERHTTCRSLFTADLPVLQPWHSTSLGHSIPFDVSVSAWLTTETQHLKVGEMAQCLGPCCSFGGPKWHLTPVSGNLLTSLGTHGAPIYICGKTHTHEISLKKGLHLSLTG